MLKITLLIHSRLVVEMVVVVVVHFGYLQCPVARLVIFIKKKKKKMRRKNMFSVNLV